ncbi:hypothetical protein ONZ45_g13614 [Pleurotus djamor]|nr:hypothetical protein ONZ45_g13614 [Pleurotus djamor]
MKLSTFASLLAYVSLSTALVIPQIKRDVAVTDAVDGDNNGWHGAENRRRDTALDNVELDNNGWHGVENKRAVEATDAVDGDNNGWHGAENKRQVDAAVDAVDGDNNGWHGAEAVRDFYAVLYLIKPFLSALCTKNDNGDYCVIKSKLPGSSSATPSGLSNNIANTGPAPLDVQDYLVANPSLTRRAPTAALVPNTTTYAESGLPYFFLSPADSADTLCTPCTRNIMTSYINYQSSVPYAGTLDQSPIFKHQPELYSAISDKCGSSFLGGAVQAAGGLKGGILGNGAPRSLGAESALTFVAVALGATAVTFSVL